MSATNITKESLHHRGHREEQKKYFSVLSVLSVLSVVKALLFALLSQAWSAPAGFISHLCVIVQP
jgi:hypothetical protein